MPDDSPSFRTLFVELPFWLYKRTFLWDIFADISHNRLWSDNGGKHDGAQKVERGKGRDVTGSLVERGGAV